MTSTSPKATILVVDDDTSVIASIAMLLKQHGYQSLKASSPEQALTLLSQHKVQLVLQDMNFSRRTSGEEGMNLLTQIKTLQPELPVILMTAWASISLAVEGIKAGASDFVTKPWDNQQLLRLITTYVDSPMSTTKTVIQRNKCVLMYEL